MVNCFRWCVGFAATCAVAGAVSGAEIPHYKVGDIATNTIVTPMALVVKDPVATALLQAKQEREIRPVVRYSPTVSDEVEQAFRSHMALLREAFIEDLTEEYGRSRIEKGLERTPKWIALTDRFRDEHKGNPKLFLFVPYWAQGRSDEHLLMDWIGRMREALDSPVRANRMPEGMTATTVRLVTVPSLDTEVELDHAERYGVLTPFDNLTTLSKAEENMAAGFTEGDRYIAAFLATFLKPNCVFDRDLTQLARGRRVDSIMVADHYAEGQTLVRIGQVIDAKVLAALEELRRQQPAPSESAVDRPARDVGGEEGRGDRVLMWWGVGGGGGLLLLLVVILLTRRGTDNRTRRSAVVARESLSSELPARLPSGEPLKPTRSEPMDRVEGESEQAWRARALAAEQKAEQARELARSSVANALKDKVVEHLSTQRDELIDHQQSAADQMAGLEARLERIQGPLSERLRAYEQRIGELEAELAIKDEENRALIEAKIQNLRERMAREKAGRGAFDLN